MNQGKITRSLSLAILIASLLILALLPFSGFFLAEQAEDNLRERLQQERVTAHQLSKLTSASTGRQSQLTLAKEKAALTPTKGLGLAGADLQNLLADIIRQGEGKPRSLQVLPPEVEGLFAKVTVQVSFTATVTALRKVVLEIERHVPFVFIDQLNIRNLSATDARKDRSIPSSSASSQRQRLEISITASNYMRTSERSEKRIE